MTEVSTFEYPDAESIQEDIVHPIITTPIFFNTLKEEFDSWRVGIHVHIEIPGKPPKDYSLFEIYGSNVDIEHYHHNTLGKVEALKANPSRTTTLAIAGVFGGGIRLASGIIITSSGLHEGLNEVVSVAIAVKYFGMTREEYYALLEEHISAGVRNRYFETVLPDLGIDF